MSCGPSRSLGHRVVEVHLMSWKYGSVLFLCSTFNSASSNMLILMLQRACPSWAVSIQVQKDYLNRLLVKLDISLHHYTEPLSY